MNMYVRLELVLNCSSERQSSDSYGLPHVVEIIVSVIAMLAALSSGPAFEPIDQPGAAVITHDMPSPDTAGRTAENRCMYVGGVTVAFTDLFAGTGTMFALIGSVPSV